MSTSAIRGWIARLFCDHQYATTDTHTTVVRYAFTGREVEVQHQLQRCSECGRERVYAIEYGDSGRSYESSNPNLTITPEQYRRGQYMGGK